MIPSELLLCPTTGLKFAKKVLRVVRSLEPQFTECLSLQCSACLADSAPCCSNRVQPAAVVKKVSPGVVVIKGTSSDGNIVGTGFLVSSDGRIATALHVIQNLKSAGS